MAENKAGHEVINALVEATRTTGTVTDAELQEAAKVINDL